MFHNEPDYSFSLPSFRDHTSLDCRIYHPQSLTRDGQASHSSYKGAIFAHPYAPLGGNYDDPVVLSSTETLLSQGFVVATFNFRGAGGSQGRTSWTGRGETEDYLSVSACLIFYLYWLSTPSDATSSATEVTPSANNARRNPLKILCGGYSYGALILARLPPPENLIAELFHADPGTTGAEIVLRARALASQTKQAFRDQLSSDSRGRTAEPGDVSPHVGIRASPVTMGGDEPDPTGRARSRSMRSGQDFIRKSFEAPQRIAERIRRHSSDGEKHRRTRSIPESDRVATAKDTVTAHEGKALPPSDLPSTWNTPPAVELFYLVVSPVIVPFTTIILPPGPPMSFLPYHRQASDAKTGHHFLSRPTLAVFGTEDSFTSASRLKAWAERQVTDAPETFQWEQIEGAGHFWHDRDSMQALQRRLMEWLVVCR